MNGNNKSDRDLEELLQSAERAFAPSAELKQLARQRIEAESGKDEDKPSASRKLVFRLAACLLVSVIAWGMLQTSRPTAAYAQMLQMTENTTAAEWVKVVFANGAGDCWLSFRPYRMAGGGKNGVIEMGATSRHDEVILRDEGACKAYIYSTKRNQITIEPIDLNESKNPADFMEWAIGMFLGLKQRDQAVELTRGERNLDGKQYATFSATLKHGSRLTLLIDAKARRVTAIALGNKGMSEDALLARLDYPDGGPADIYALGARRDATIADLTPSEDVQAFDARIRAARRAFAPSYRALVGLGVEGGAGRVRPICVNVIYKKGQRYRIESRKLVIGRDSLDLQDTKAMEAWVQQHPADEVLFIGTDGRRQRFDRQADGDYAQNSGSSSARTVEQIAWGDEQEMSSFDPAIRPADDEENRGLQVRISPNKASAPQQVRHYYDPARDYLRMRLTWTDLPNGAQHTGLCILEAAQTPQRQWYPVRASDGGALYLIYLDTHYEAADGLMEPKR